MTQPVTKHDVVKIVDEHTLCEDDVRKIVKEHVVTEGEIRVAVEKGVTAALLSLGINNAEAGEALEVQRDMAFVRKLRTGNDAMKSKGFLMVVGSVISALIALTTIGFMSIFGGQPN